MSQATERSSGFERLSDGGPLLHGWLALIAIGLLVGLYGVFRLLTEGTGVLGISSQLSWGILISTYVFFVLLSTGICIGVTSMASVFGMEKYERVAKRGVFLSLITLMAGGVVIMVSLGQPLRAMPMMLLSPNPASPLWWMIGLYGIYGVALFAEFYLIESDRTVPRRVTMLVGLIALVAAIAAHSTLGAIFGFAEARPYYGGIFGPVYFILSAILSGLAVMSFVTIAEYKLSAREIGDEMRELLTENVAKSLALVVAITIFFVAWKILSGLTATSTTSAEAYRHMLFGPPAWWYWTLGITLGLLIPFALLVYPKTRSVNGLLAASGAILVGVFVTRYEYVVGGQILALTNDPSYEYPIVSYTPTLIELSVVVFGFAVFALLYTVGRELFDLNEIPGHEHDSSPTNSPRSGATTGDDSND